MDKFLYGFVGHTGGNRNAGSHGMLRVQLYFFKKNNGQACANGSSN